MNFDFSLIGLFQSGVNNLASYLAAHVLLCLVPAFFIAGGLSALVPKESVTHLLGRNARKYIAYPAAALAGSVLAVCSCTIIPLFAGIYKKGAGLGPAITFLFFAPAGNILALAYTGVAIGGDLALARLILSLSFGIGIGLIMAVVFSREDIAHTEETDNGFSGKSGLNKRTVVLLLLLVSLLIFGTLKIPMLLNTYANFSLPINGINQFESLLARLVPFDASQGEEGVTAQGFVLIILLILIAVAASLGLKKVDQGYNRWTWVALALITLTLVFAGITITPLPGMVNLGITGKWLGVVLALLAIWLIASKYFEAYEIQQWLWETWRFVRQIFPLLIVGVFLVGIIREIIRPEWIEAIAGSNSILGNVAGVIFGVFMYFPTLVEVPIAKMFLSLGMHRGPLLAYLMSDPELSLQSILVTATIIGKDKAWTYVGLVALFSTISGLAYGARVDGYNIWLLALYILLFLSALVFSIVWIDKRRSAQ
jgi:uncharacterized membrane protein YraQ (UPF0718 family)